ncbi:pyrroline-5-carboxylate reductase [Endothiovibrio diazotrophicus]
MARSLIGGLVSAGMSPDRIWVADPDAGQLEMLRGQQPVHATRDNDEAVLAADVLVLAVKPQMLGEVAEGIRGAVQSAKPLVISVAAGVREPDLQRWLGGGVALVRTMPNTPSLVQCGATALCAGPDVTTAQRELAENVMRAVGLTLWVENEGQMDAVTAVSGSGPAYFFLLMELMEEAGRSLGLTQKSARLLATQTAFGAAKMALESNEDAATLRRRVTSPNGTTERALKIMEEGGMRELIHKALEGARDRSRELADELGGK